MVPRTAAAVSTGSVLEMQILLPQTSPETLGVGPSNLYFNKLPGNSDLYLGITALEDVALIHNYNE